MGVNVWSSQASVFIIVSVWHLYPPGLVFFIRLQINYSSKYLRGTCWVFIRVSQSAVICEDMIESITTDLGLYPDKVREINFLSSGQHTPYGRIVEKCHVTLITNVVYYESMKWNLKIKPIYECRCNGRLQTKRFTRLTHTESVVELEHLKIKTRLTNEKFAIVKGECEI
jgi:hypothetical protein